MSAPSTATGPHASRRVSAACDNAGSALPAIRPLFYSVLCHRPKPAGTATLFWCDSAALARSWPVSRQGAQTVAHQRHTGECALSGDPESRESTDACLEQTERKSPQQAHRPLSPLRCATAVYSHDASKSKRNPPNNRVDTGRTGGHRRIDQAMRNAHRWGDVARKMQIATETPLWCTLASSRSSRNVATGAQQSKRPAGPVRTAAPRSYIRAPITAVPVQLFRACCLSDMHARTGSTPRASSTPPGPARAAAGALSAWQAPAAAVSRSGHAPAPCGPTQHAGAGLVALLFILPFPAPIFSYVAPPASSSYPGRPARPP